MKRLLIFAPPVFGLLATLFLTYSIKITASPFRAVQSNGHTELCYDGKLLGVGYGGVIGLSDDACAGWNQAKPTALVAADHPIAGYFGLFLLVVGFAFDISERFRKR